MSHTGTIAIYRGVSHVALICGGAQLNWERTKSVTQKWLLLVHSLKRFVRLNESFVNDNTTESPSTTKKMYNSCDANAQLHTRIWCNFNLVSAHVHLRTTYSMHTPL